MKILKVLLIIVTGIGPIAALAQRITAADSLLDHLTGKWVLKGTIAGRNIEHDISAEWVLGHQYLELKETAREKLADGRPSYDAIVFLYYDTPMNQYDVLWLDNTATTDFNAKAIAHAPFKNNIIALLFNTGSKSLFHTTLSYRPNQNTWHWKLESDENGKIEVFADAEMTKE